jgi:hypothetical protein
MMSGAQLRGVALSLPETEERETWGESTFRVRDKIFATMGPDGRAASVKATPEEQAALVATDPDTFAVAHYVGRFGWVAVQLSTVDPDLMEGLIIDAWRRTAPKRLVAAQDAKRS